MKEENFDFEAFKKEAIRKLKDKEPGVTAENLFKPLFKRFIEEALDAEMDEHLNEEEREQGNRKNGKTSKTVKSTNGSFELDTPRDRSGTFDPKLVGKRQTLISEEIEDKVLRFYFFERNNKLYLATQGDTVFKYDINGQQIWAKPIPTSPFKKIQIKTSNRHIYGLTGDGNNTSPLQLNKFDTLGNLLWTVQVNIGYLWGMAVDTAGNTYLQSDYLKKINTNGGTDWIIANSYGADSVGHYNCSVDNDTVYACGFYYGMGQRLSVISLYSAQTGSFIKRYMFDIVPGIGEEPHHIIKKGNYVYIAGFTAEQYQRLFVAKISLSSLPAGLISTSFKESSFTIYPNPTSGIITIKSSDPSSASGSAELRIENVLGQLVYTKKINTNGSGVDETINLSQYPKGIYFVQINTGSLVEVRKIVLE